MLLQWLSPSQSVQVLLWGSERRLLSPLYTKVSSSSNTRGWASPLQVFWAQVGISRMVIKPLCRSAFLWRAGLLLHSTTSPCKSYFTDPLQKIVPGLKWQAFAVHIAINATLQKFPSLHAIALLGLWVQNQGGLLPCFCRQKLKHEARPPVWISGARFHTTSGQHRRGRNLTSVIMCIFLLLNWGWIQFWKWGQLALVLISACFLQTEAIDQASTWLLQQINELKYSLGVIKQCSPWRTSELKRLALGYLFGCTSPKAWAQWTILITADSAPWQCSPWPCKPSLPERAAAPQTLNWWPPTPCHCSGLTARNISAQYQVWNHLSSSLSFL